MHQATANNWDHRNHISKCRLFDVLDTLRPTLMGLNKFSAWFLKYGAPFLFAQLFHMFNLSLALSVVPQQGKAASIIPIPKSSIPLQPAVYRLISILHFHHHLLGSAFMIKLVSSPLVPLMWLLSLPYLPLTRICYTACFGFIQGIR